MESEQDQIEKLQSKIAQLSVLYSISTGIGLTPYPDNVLEFVLDKAVSVLNAEVGAILLIDEEKQALSISHASGLNRETIEQTEIKPGEGIAGKVAQSGEMIIVNNLQEKPEIIDSFVKWYPVQSVLCTPIKIKDKTLGVIHLSRLSNAEFMKDEIWILTVLTKRANVALESAQLYQDLKESEKRFKDVALSSADWIWEVNEKGIYTYCSKKVEDLLGYKTDEIVGKTPFDFMPTEEAERIRETFFQIAKNKGNITDLENWILTKYGKRICFLTNGVPILDEYGNLKGYRGVGKDITERKQIEEALRESEERHRSLVESIGLGLVLVDCDYNIVMMNAHHASRFNKAPSEFVGKKCFKEQANRDAVCPHCPGVQAMATGKHVVVEIEGEEGYGIRRYLRLHAFPTYGQDGKVTGFSEISEDITEIRQLQSQLERSRKMEAIGTLAGGVAHDLNNILSGLVTYPELLLMEIPKESPLREDILNIQKSGEKAATIVQDLLTLARRGVGVTKVLNLNHIVSEYIKSPEFEKLKLFHPEVQLETDLETDLLNISGSPVHLSKTIMNLVSNAAEAMPHGGKIFISTKNRHIDRPIRVYEKIEEGDYVVLIVSDTGVGISSEDMERIFEPFYTKKVMGRSGTGLGMAVVWGTVKDHKGHIDIQSTQGEGTTFTLYFPVTRKELTEDQSLFSIEDYMGKGESILVVDDVIEQRKIATGILNKLGYSVTSVSSGEEAVDYMKNNSADLLVLDMIMAPGMDGLETYKKILEFHPGQKAIIASGFSETERVREAQRLGAGDYLKKPYSLEKIASAIKAELDR